MTNEIVFTDKRYHKAKRIKANGYAPHRLVSPTGGVIFAKVLVHSKGYIILRVDKRRLG